MFEYMFMRGPDPDLIEFNKFGKQGWELVTTTTENHHMGATLRHTWYFKRALPDK